MEEKKGGADKRKEKEREGVDSTVWLHLYCGRGKERGRERKGAEKRKEVKEEKKKRKGGEGNEEEEAAAVGRVAQPGPTRLTSLADGRGRKKREGGKSGERKKEKRKKNGEE